MEAHTQPRAADTSADPERRFIKRAMQEDLLEREEEQDLAFRWRDQKDERALHALTQAYMRLVIAMAARFRKYGLPMADLIQEGNVGLMLAAAKFEPGRDVRFSTYASWWIRSSIQDYVLRNWSIVRTGTTSAQKSLFFNLRRVRAMIADAGGGMMTPENRARTARLLKVREEDVDTMTARLSAADRSLNAPTAAEGEQEWQDLLADDRATPDEDVMERHDAERREAWIADAMTVLTEREQAIIRRRKLGEDTDTLEAIGNDLGISKERVRQIETQALGKLKAALVARVGDPEDAGLIP
ncbi:RNA polymerase factor sigma-32 [Hyphobacterium marinum]|uniref:RNA polymerase factor sigma-32 n=1 Tax=Hyphobacterium marinum TaxID=3116574 RepID=A0ABU7LZ64_9PROT|nr:RNA polymerase factor sigma-32 [Hyphobacterium sp. Y6023]MEE2566280.1 RNA polymerase factor sigma-32 [Hyphobacterium sp. Y6023]